MASAVALPRSLLIFSMCIPLAVLLGFLLATPLDFSSLVLVSSVLVVLCLPLLIRWHHPILIFSLNATINIFFLPGEPSLWMLMGGLSLMISLLARALSKEMRFVNVPAVTWPLVCLILVLLVTARLTGGIGVRVLGGETYGGKRYIYMFAAVIVYFAITAQQIPLARCTRYAALFFLPGVTAAMSNIAYSAGPAFYFLYLMFPADLAVNQAAADWSLTSDPIVRLTGISFAAVAVYSGMLIRYGIRGLFDWSQPWRLPVFLLAVGGIMAGGFRSSAIVIGLIFIFQFYFERLFRTRLFFVFLLGALLGGAILVPIVSQLPLSVQRALSFLPLDVDPMVQQDARFTYDWRLEMWQVLVPEVPKYLWLGKGFAVDPADLYLTQESIRRGMSRSYEGAIISGDYHNGPLSLLIPFGLWGMLTFVWLCSAGLWVLYRNYRHGEPVLHKINTFLLAYFAARVVFFFTLFGSISTDLVIFASTLGLSISLNGGVRGKQNLPLPAGAQP